MMSSPMYGAFFANVVSATEGHSTPTRQGAHRRRRCATRLLRYVADLDKTYTAEVVLGSDLDPRCIGEVVATAEMSEVTIDEVGPRRKAHRHDRADSAMVSAIRVGGKRLYELARAGEEIERAPRSVTSPVSTSLRLLTRRGRDRGRLHLGTYVRSSLPISEAHSRFRSPPRARPYPDRAVHP